MAGAVLGYLAKSKLEKKDKKNIDKSKSINEIKKAANLISAKEFSLMKDLTWYEYYGKSLYKLEELSSPWPEKDEELYNLAKTRISDNCQELIKLDVKIDDEDLEYLEDKINSYVFTCKNLKRIIELKGFDQDKVSLIKMVEKELEDKYTDLMSSINSIYK
ncbi:DUF4476 domain-containing protein [Planococcus citreus]|uniref:Uncharacterized protein DUF4476 n=1 Tax=Planococcus citreus TaxID=1373 RepID=A0A497YGP2_9BACL|nr:DUF4476 domain-containing protein [Planococcus citreus]RLJ90136.1 uncharacterized protein DUF4476 [Planococcus citreus]